ncbi:M56 family metallopeptidase [Brevibacillus sp. 179-C9.3 HS]|uniref:M56 family metallopeptidase n=1 Tax=unclassified Brevibacillus TaxID=2684853 RepID=UPI0039A2BB8F
MELLCQVFLWMSYASLGASLVAILLVAIKKGVRQAISWRMHHLLWFIVLARLLVPVLPESSFSLFTWISLASNSLSVVQPLSPSLEPEVTHTEPLVIPAVQDMSGSVENGGVMQMEAVSDDERRVTSTHAAYIQILALVWLIGMVVMLVRLFVYLYNMHTKERFLMRVTDERVLTIMKACKEKFGVKRQMPVYTGTLAKGPFISGLFAPWIYCPRDVYQSLSDDELYHVFAHELAHHKRKDLLWSFLGSLALAIHWMNPLVWLSIRKMKADMELACDEYVLDVLGEKEAIPYGMTLLAFARQISEKRPMPYPLYFHHSHHSEQMKRRIQMISTFKKGSYQLSAVAVACGLVISAVTLTNAAEPTSLQVAVKQDDKMRPLFGEASFQFTNRLEKAEKMVDFAFKVPTYLPAGFTFESSGIMNAKQSDSSEKLVSLNFRKDGDAFSISASKVEETADAVYASLDNKKIPKYTMAKEQLSVKGKPVTLISRTSHLEDRDVKLDIYLWSDGGVYYQIQTINSKTKEEFVKVIESLAAPNEKLRKQYANNDMQNISILDLDDVGYFSTMMGIEPVFPLELPGGFKAKDAFVSKKLNFSFPANKEEEEKRTMHVTLEKPKEANAKGIQLVRFAQIKDKSIVENMKKTKTVPFYRIDGQKFDVKVTPLNIGGQEVFRTEPYKIDGTMSGPDEKNNYSYFWLKGEVCYKATFVDEGTEEQQQLVTALIKAKAIDLKK